MLEDPLEVSAIKPLILVGKLLYLLRLKRQSHPAKDEGTNLGLLNPHSVQRGRSQAACPVHSGGLHAEQQSSVQGHHTASGADWEACSPPFAICLLNLCPRLLRPHPELLLGERAELSRGPHTLHQAKVKDPLISCSA